MHEDYSKTYEEWRSSNKFTPIKFKRSSGEIEYISSENVRVKTLTGQEMRELNKAVDDLIRAILQARIARHQNQSKKKTLTPTPATILENSDAFDVKKREQEIKKIVQIQEFIYIILQSLIGKKLQKKLKKKQF